MHGADARKVNATNPRKTLSVGSRGCCPSDEGAAAGLAAARRFDPLPDFLRTRSGRLGACAREKVVHGRIYCFCIRVSSSAAGECLRRAAGGCDGACSEGSSPPRLLTIIREDGGPRAGWMPRGCHGAAGAYSVRVTQPTDRTMPRGTQKSFRFLGQDILHGQRWNVPVYTAC